MSDDARFVRDRLEITNLVHNYSHHADAGAMDAWIDLFTDDVAIDIDGTRGGREILEGYRTAAADAPPSTDRTRHVMSNLVFHAQDEGTATGSVYLTFVRTASGTPGVEVTGQYDFDARRTADGWRLCSWRALLDSRLG